MPGPRGKFARLMTRQQRNHPSARLMERIGMHQEARFVHNQIVKDSGQTSSCTPSSIMSGEHDSPGQAPA
jgi:hypothetical protein